MINITGLDKAEVLAALERIRPNNSPDASRPDTIARRKRPGETMEESIKQAPYFELQRFNLSLKEWTPLGKFLYLDAARRALAIAWEPGGPPVRIVKISIEVIK